MHRSQHSPPSEEEPYVSSSKHSQSDNNPTFERKVSPERQYKNVMANYGIKNNVISGTYGRIIPKKPIHDYEQLYAENLQLKQQIRNIEDMFVKTKTRLSMMEKQKSHQKLQTKASYISDFSRPIISRGTTNQRKSVHLQKNSYQISAAANKRHSNDENRKILHEYQDKIKKLELENNRLKKTVKYTKIQEIQIQNGMLHEQMAKLKEYIEELIQNTDYQQYEIQIERLKKQIQGQKQTNRGVAYKLKRKDQEIQELKEKVKQVQNNKVDIERRLTREVSSYKGELSRVREKQKQLAQHQNNFNFVEENKVISYKRKNSKSGPNATNSSFHNAAHMNCEKCAELNKKVQNLNSLLNGKENKLKERQAQISQLNHQIQELNQQIKVKQQRMKQFQQTNKEVKIHNKEEKINQASYQQQNQEKDDRNQKEIKRKTSEFQDDEEEQYQFDEQQYGQNQNIDQKSPVSNKKSNVKNKNQQKNTPSSKKPEKQHYQVQQFDLKEYEDQFADAGDNESQEQMLFQKKQYSDHHRQKTNKKQKVTDIEKKGRAKETKKNQRKLSSTEAKAEKILQQTIKYRLIGQRYSYEDFVRDIKESEATQFGIQELIEMLTNEPFLLHQEHLEMLLIKILNKNQFQADDTIETDKFMKSIKSMFEGVALLDQQYERSININVQNKIKKNSEAIYQEFQKQGNREEISKKGFVKVLTNKLKLNEEEIEQCLSEASVFSKDIAHINYPVFMENILNPPGNS